MKARQSQIFILVVIALILKACANIGNPTGGPKDIIPPKILKSEPVINGTNFKGKEIDIQFDELIKIEGMDEKFVSSPPLKKRPLITTRGRSLLVKFDEELQDNATYTLDFADAISDNNEGNKLSNFRFSFSTGSVVDSFAISGNVYDAQTLTPIESSLVLLYNNLSDTAFSAEVPLRLAKTDKKGFFSIHNIGQGTYRVYALMDANRNYIFDQPGEEIAWNKETFSPSTEIQSIRDTSLIRTLTVKDTTKIDSLITKLEKVYLPNKLQLFLYQQDFKTQYLETEQRKDRSKIDLCFSRPISGNVELRLSSDSLKTIDSWAIRQNAFNKDTISYWITDTLISNLDSLALSVKYQTTDSLNRPYAKIDSFVAYFFEKPAPKRKLRKGEVIPLPSLSLSGMPSTHEIYLPYPIILPSPAIKFNKDGIKVYEQRDTIRKEIPYELIKDSVNPTRYLIKNKWEYGVSYFVAIDSATFTNSYGIVNNTVSSKFDIKAENSYGRLLLTLENSDENSLVQLVNGKDEVLRQQYVPKNGKMAFQFLKPGEYFLKIVEDENKNKKYDFGNFQLGIMPEKVVYYPDKLSIRANWRHDIKWDVATFDLYKFVNTFRTSPKKTKE